MIERDVDEFGNPRDPYQPGQDVFDDPSQLPKGTTPSGAGAIPTNPDGSQVGSGTPWGPNGPTSAPAGYHWDPNLAMFQPDAPTPTTTGAPAPAGNHSRIDAALQAAGSTDDPNYWYGKIDGDPNGYGSAWDYWSGRINQGDGAAGVRNGTVQKFQDGTVAAPLPGGTLNGPTQTSFIQPGPTFVGQAPSSGNSDFLNQFQAAMLRQLSALNDPNAAAQNAQPAIDANRVSSERGLADENNSIAESLYARDPGLLHSGALDTLKQQARERATTNQATFAGNAVMSQNALRQQALMSLLGLGSNQITSSNALGQQASQFNDQMGFNYANLGVNANYNAMLLALQGAGL